MLCGVRNTVNLDYILLQKTIKEITASLLTRLRMMVKKKKIPKETHKEEYGKIFIGNS